jgi:hypothetical protein
MKNFILQAIKTSCGKLIYNICFEFDFHYFQKTIVDVV